MFPTRNSKLRSETLYSIDNVSSGDTGRSQSSDGFFSPGGTLRENVVIVDKDSKNPAKDKSLWDWAFGERSSGSTSTLTYSFGSGRSRSNDVKAWLTSMLDLRQFPTKKARDVHALKLGQRWLKLSGGLRKKNDAAKNGIAYTHYVSQFSWNDPSSSDSGQIEKDIRRTCLSQEVHKGLYQYFENATGPSSRDENGKADPKKEESLSDLGSGLVFDVRAELRRVLAAVVLRNKSIGYTQGMNYIACLFLGMMREEDAFWTMCAVVEDLRPHDYYSPSPRTLGGYHLDARILDAVVKEVFPTLKADGTPGSPMGGPVMDIGTAIGLCYPKWLLPLFYSELRFDTMLVLWDAFFSVSPSILPPEFKAHLIFPKPPAQEFRAGCGESALFACILTIASKALSASQKPENENVFSLLRTITSKLTPMDLQNGFGDFLPTVSPPLLRRRRRRARNRMARASNAAPWGIPLLAEMTRLPERLVEDYQAGYWGWVSGQGNTLGVESPTMASPGRMSGFGFRTHLSVQEEGEWLEVVHPTPIQVRNSPGVARRKNFSVTAVARSRSTSPISSGKDGKSRTPKAKSSSEISKIKKGLRMKLKPRSRIRKLEEKDGWVRHSKGWSPRWIKGIAAMETIDPPSLGLEKDTFYALVEACGIPSKLFKTLHKMADVDKNGKIDFAELITILAPLRPTAPAYEHVKAVFLLFDKHGTGLLPPDRARALAADLHLPKHLNERLSDILRQASGFLSLDSFVHLLLTPPKSPSEGSSAYPFPPPKIPISAPTREEKKSTQTISENKVGKKYNNAAELGVGVSESKGVGVKSIVAELLRPISVDLDSLLPIWAKDVRRGGGGLKVTVRIFKAVGVFARGGGLLGGLLGGGSTFYCRCQTRFKSNRSIIWKSKVKAAVGSTTEWNESFTHELIPPPPPNRPAPPLALLLRDASLEFSVWEKTVNGEDFSGEVQCRLHQLKQGHELAAGYSLGCSEGNLSNQNKKITGKLHVNVLLEAVTESKDRD
ncbi:hypothetical protein AAMO2058_001485300 [Amorphochlora amoebiformis]